MWEQKLRCASILCSLGLPLMMSEHHSGVTELCSDGEVHTMLHFHPCLAGEKAYLTSVPVPAVQAWSEASEVSYDYWERAG